MLERGVALSQEADMPLFYHPTATGLALAYALAGRATDALSLLQQDLKDSPSSAGRPISAPGRWMRPTAGPAWVGTPVSTTNGARRRGPCGCSARLPCIVTRRPRARRRALPAGPHPGRRTRHAPTPGPLSPGPGHPIRQHRPAGAGSRRPGRRHRAVPRHGDDLLAAAGRGGARASRLRKDQEARAALSFHARQNAWARSADRNGTEGVADTTLRLGHRGR